MKKLFVLPALVVGLLVSTQNITANEIASTDTVEVAVQDEYIDVAVENLPQAVLDAVAKDFPGATVAAAGAKEDASEFKLVIAKEDGEAAEVYCDAEGNWITKE